MELETIILLGILLIGTIVMNKEIIHMDWGDSAKKETTKTK